MLGTSKDPLGYTRVSKEIEFITRQEHCKTWANYAAFSSIFALLLPSFSSQFSSWLWGARRYSASGCRVVTVGEERDD